MTAYRRVALTAKPHLTQKEETMRLLFHTLRNAGMEVLVDTATLGDVDALRQCEAYAFGDPVDALIVVGGDGTILRAVRSLPDLSVPILTVNRGSVGFLTEVAMDEVAELLPSLLAGDSMIEQRHLLQVEVTRAGEVVFTGHVLNEAAISQGAIARLLDVRTSIGSEVLATFHADGLILATPTGSTAYSLAAGGPVVHPRLDAIILTPINSHSLTQKPIVIPGDSIVRSEILMTSIPSVLSHISLTLDGQEYFPLHGEDFVTVRLHPSSVRFIRRMHDTFYQTLRTKLRWG